MASDPSVFYLSVRFPFLRSYVYPITSGGSKGVLWKRALSVQFLSFSCSLRQTFCQIIGGPRPLGLLSASLGNPGSATAYLFELVGLYISSVVKEQKSFEE